MQADDKDYFTRRAKREREIADSCQDKSVANVHKQLAEKYENKANGVGEDLLVARDG